MRRTFLGMACVLILILTGGLSAGASPSFGEITLADIMEASLSALRIDASSGSSNAISPGAIIAFRTDEGRYGVMEVVSCDQNLVLNWRTYNSSGTVFGSGDSLLVHATWTCDLDRGVEGSASADFHWDIVSSTEKYIDPMNGAQFALLTLPEMFPDTSGGLFAPQAPRLAYSVLPPRSFSLVIPEITLSFDLRTDEPLSKREWTQWGLSIPQPGAAGDLSVTMQCICRQHYLEDWQYKPSTYWPHATQYLISDPTPSHWDTFALCIDVPNLTWGAAAGYRVSIVPTSVFTSFRAGSGATVPSAQKIAISPSPTLATGPMHAQGGTIRSPYVAHVTFYQVALEWFAWSGQARLRAGDVVLMSDLGVQWLASDPNTIQITPGFGSFEINLATGKVDYVNWKAGGTRHATALTVTIDDSPTNIIPFEPHLWW
jgi:hypothetical protein